MNPQEIIEAKAFYRNRIRRIWVDSLNEPTSVSNIRNWKLKFKQYSKRLLSLENLEPDDTHLMFIVKCAICRLDENLEVLSRV